MVLSPREELLAIQKSLFRSNQRLIEESILVKEPDFDAYEKTYKSHVRTFEAIAPFEEMFQAIDKADIVYVGDYHTCNQSQRSFLRILKAMARRKHEWILGLELLHKRHQKIIDSFMSDKISEPLFLKQVGLRKHWVFDLWENFKSLFDFAKYHAIPIFGIDAAGKGATIKERDRASAQLIAQMAKLNPNKKIFIFIGDLHVAPPHLPKEVNAALKKLGLQKRELILYQNSESIYWRLVKQGLEDLVEVVRIDEKSYCRMHTPPVICQRSYLNWLEHEEGEIDYADPKHSFLELVDRISHFLKIDLGKEKDRVEVFTCGDLSFLDRIKESGRFSPEEFKAIKRQIINSESYYIPKLRFAYLSNLSINHAGEEAAHFIKHICSGEEKPREPFDALYANILHEALGFFGSKIINHKRKCYHEKDFQKLLTYFQNISPTAERRLEYETALIVQEAKKLESEGEAISDIGILSKRPDLFFTVSHALGYMLGDKLYYAMLDSQISKTEVRHLFYDPWKGYGKPFQTYWSLLQKTQSTKIPKRM
ncbi:MAG: hypothetical protein A3H42_00095 [Deltaproteobacteria bacterium RIFCSPLOWO2_02_FULL_46_8]|nr:MAG: hypothetical protein A3H42_00095 [Deltaproteobacteria bacterium RIFCSPLOWO2_02_FULL_46_8]